jgi:zinc carboxypeptidase/carboxypeptidase family protein
MIRRFLILLIALSLLSQWSYSQGITNDNRLRGIVDQYGQVEVTVNYTDRVSADKLSRNVSLLSVSDKLIYISLSKLTVGWFIKQKLNYKIVEKTGNKGIVSAYSVSKAMDWETYPTYTQYDSIMRSFASTYPDLCSLDTIGTSIYGKLLLTLKISDNVSVHEEEPEVFYTSTMHGDETGGYVLMLRFADYLLTNYNTDSRIKELVDNLQIWINPLANPDGTYKTGDIISPSPTRYNANGVDLNRNFPDPFQPSVIQEKENIDMIKFMREHKFVISANFHSGAEVVNYPWDRWYSKYHADDVWFNNISRAYADTVHVYSGDSYMNFMDKGVTRGAVWYIIYGGRQDFVTYELQGREVTIELDNQHVTPSAQLPLLWMYNKQSLIGYLENALFGIHGLVKNISTQAPVSAKVYITGHDKDSSQVYSDTLTGSFVRLLSPGSWDLTFSANGYYDTTITNIQVFSRQRTDLNVNMNPITNNVDTTIPGTPVIYPNPVKTEFKAILPDGIIGSVNVRIINQSGTLVADYNTEVFLGVPLIINAKRLSGGAYTIIFTSNDARISFRARFMVVK